MNKERRKNKDTEKKKKKNLDQRVGNLRRDGFDFVVSTVRGG